MAECHEKPGLRGIVALFLGLALQLCAPCALLADSVVVINEIMFHPRAGEPEWIELYNQMGTLVDLSGWSLTGAVEYTFPAGTILAPDSYVVVASAAGGLEMTASPVLGPFDGKLSNAGEEIRLLNNSGRLMNRVRYDDGGDWPVAADGSGCTLAKIDPTRESDASSNWTWSDRIGGTPNAPNFSPPVADEPLPSATGGLRLNEICPAGQSDFFVEIVNVGAESAGMADVWLEVQGSRDFRYGFADEALGPGQYMTLAAGDLGFVPQPGDRLFLGRGDDRVCDAVRVGDTVTGRHPAGTGPWLFPSLATPGQPNEVDLCTDIVINEIMYHPLALPVVDTAQGLLLFDENATVKVLVPQDDRLGRRWTGGFEPFDDGAWIQGVGTGVGYEASSGYEPYIDVDVRAEMYGRRNTVYVRIPFEVVDPRALATLTLNIRYDDGFLAFLNGTLIAGANMSGSEAWDDPAAASNDDLAAVSYQGFDVSDHLDELKAGVNILAIEGHNIGLTSSDLLFQATLEATVAESSGDQEQDGESKTWVELYNRGTATVDLSGWSFDKGITYTFPEGTSLPAGGYLVVARNRAYLAAKFPDAAIVGDFQGRLANGGEELRLLDARGNPVDRLRYYDGGTWPEAADGGGSSLELRDPWADNDCGAAWAASDESLRSSWQTISYRETVQASSVGNDSLYHEFVMGLLDVGEILIDDIHVVEDPGGAAQERLANGDFSHGLDHWRIVGNHRHSTIETDPSDGTNPVLRLVATGPTEHMHNHAETTFANGVRINNGREVEIRFRAKWISGSPLLHTRLFFNRLARTTILAVPSSSGTPGRVNSCRQPNIGPTMTALRHSPPVPLPDQTVEVAVRATDPDGVEKVTLWYRPDNGTWQATEMSGQEDRFTAVIPPHASHALVQFYVEAQDGRGFVAFCPAAGPESFAQYRVLQIDLAAGRPSQPPQASGPFAPRTTGVFNYRIVMRDAERDFLYEPTNRMSNEHLGATLIVNEQDVYYDVGVHLKGSEHGRPKDPRIGFHLRFNPEKLFRGVHRTIGFDRSDGQQVGQREMLQHVAMNRFGGFSKYHDLGYLIAPRQQQCSGVEVQLARYGPVYCEEAYGEQGGAGTVYEYELVYTLAETVGNDPEGLKIPQEGGGVYGRSVTDYLGTDKEKYRWHFLIKNNRDLDDYEPVIRLTQALGLGQTAFESSIAETIDVEQWLQAFAVGSTFGITDNWISNSSHNAMFYFRPTDGRFAYFPHDLDYYNANQALESNSVLSKLLRKPAWAHAFYGNVYDFLQVSFNRVYLSAWADHFAQLLPEQAWSSWLAHIDQRYERVMNQVLARAGNPIPFEITAPSAKEVAASSVAIRGRAWIHVQRIDVVETSQALALEWLDLTTWETHLPDDLAPGAYTLGAYNSLGSLLATDTITLMPRQ